MESGFYDSSDAVAAYLAHRHAAVHSPNLVMEEPAVMSVLGAMQGLTVADLGCGDGTFLSECLALGALSCLGVDSSAAMLEVASTQLGADERVRLVEQRLEEIDLAPEAFDVIAARMSLHYVADLAPVLAVVRAALRPGGRFVATVVHPVVTSARIVAQGPRSNVVVDDYFDQGPRDRRWFDRSVRWQHRTIEHYFTALRSAGLCPDELRECEPVEALFDGDEEEHARRRRVPLFLLLSAAVRAD